MKNFASNLNSPIPTNLSGECKKAANILNGFIDAGQGLDKIIPENILEKAQGLAIYTVLKAGFLFSGRAGSGLVVARLPEGGWSAPSAIGTGGIGAGGQIGAEITDFVLVLNTHEAVKTFSQGGNVTLGGNVSVAAGPVGRTAEASGTATLKHVSAIYSYSKTRGLFAGVSLEGSIVVTRNDANEKFYGKKVTAKELLSGVVPPPPEADVLYRALNAKFHTLGTQTYSRGIDSESVTRSNTFKNSNISAPGTLKQPPPIRQSHGYGAPMPPPPVNNNYSNSYNSTQPPSSSYQHNPTQPPSSSYQHNSTQPPSSNYQHNQHSPVPPPSYTSNSNDYSNNGYNNNSPSNNGYTRDIKPTAPYNSSRFVSDTQSNYSQQATVKRPPPPPPPARKPAEPLAKALYSFDGQQEGDLSFREGEIITVIKKTQSQDDWWSGRIGTREGTFPANYVQLM